MAPVKAAVAEAPAPLRITEAGPKLVPPAKTLLEQRMPLYDVTLESMLIEEALIEAGGELTPAIEERFDRLLLQGPRAIDAAVAIIRELGASAKVSYEEETRLYNRKKSFERNAETLKERVRQAVDSPMFNGKVKTPRFTVWTQKAQDRLEVEFQALDDSLENLFNTRPDLVERTVVYKLKDVRVKEIWEDERPQREELAKVTRRREEYDDAVAMGVTPDGPVPRKPNPFESRLPTVVAVAEVPGRRFLQVR